MFIFWIKKETEEKNKIRMMEIKAIKKKTKYMDFKRIIILSNRVASIRNFL